MVSLARTVSVLFVWSLFLKSKNNLFFVKVFHFCSFQILSQFLSIFKKLKTTCFSQMESSWTKSIEFRNIFRSKKFLIFILKFSQQNQKEVYKRNWMSNLFNRKKNIILSGLNSSEVNKITDRKSTFIVSLQVYLRRHGNVAIEWLPNLIPWVYLNLYIMCVKWFTTFLYCVYFLL
jgi:hypothetical protein